MCVCGGVCGCGCEARWVRVIVCGLCVLHRPRVPPALPFLSWLHIVSEVVCGVCLIVVMCVLFCIVCDFMHV